MINSNERFTRWQQALREQLTFLNNLILTLSIGSLGFIFSLLNKSRFVPIDNQKLFFTISLFLFFISILLGLTTSFSRLFDFRTTVKKIKIELTTKNPEVESLKELMDLYSKWTWRLFYGQVIVFAVGIITLSISLFLVYKDKLF